MTTAATDITSRQGSLGEYTMPSVAIVLAFLLLSFDMVAAPLRFYLSRVGLDFLTYLPKVFCLLYAAREVAKVNIDRRLFWFVLLLLVFAVVGFLHQIGYVSQIFSLLLIAPLLFGMTAGRQLLAKEEKLVWVLTAVFLVTALGIYLEGYCSFPWKGFEYKVAGTAVEGSREWSTFGLARRAGFTRTSASAAYYLVCSSLFLYSYSSKWWLKLSLLVVAFPAVALTTSKAGLLGFLAGVFAVSLVRWPLLRKVYVYLLALVVILFPASTLVRNYDLNISDPISLLLLASFEDRLINTWPSFFQAVAELGNPFTGLGFGAVGAASKYFAGQKGQALAFADNFALYLYGNFGLFVAVALFLYFAKVTDQLFCSAERPVRAMAPVMVSVLAAALSTDVIESQVFALMLGVAISMAPAAHPWLGGAACGRGEDR
jgi:O-antigen ligase